MGAEAWQFLQDAAPAWSTRYHIPIVVAAATGLLLLAGLMRWLYARQRRKRLYDRFKRSRW